MLVLVVDFALVIFAAVDDMIFDTFSPLLVTGKAGTPLDPAVILLLLYYSAAILIVGVFDTVVI